MNNSLITLIGVPIAGFAIAAGTIPLARRIGLRLGISASRSGDLQADERVPVFGGAAIVAGIIGSLAMFGVLPGWVAFCAATMWAVGVIDDARELRPREKLAAQLIVAIAVVMAIPRVALSPWPVLDFALAVLWLTAISNAFNLIDGLDGLAAGAGIVAGGAVAVTGILQHDPALATIGMAIAARSADSWSSTFIRRRFSWATRARCRWACCSA